MQVKTCPAQIKAAGTHEGTDEGVFEAIVATYDVDSVGDRIIPGAFKNTLEQWKSAGNPIPVVWSHKSDDPEYHIGEVLEAEERQGGLWVKARLDIDEPGSKSAKVYKLLKGRRVTQMSFAYDEVDARPIEKSADGATKELHELKVYEVGPCMIGANQRTQLLGVKHEQSPVTVNVNTPTLDQETAAAIAAFQQPLGGRKTTDSATGQKAGRVLSKQNEDRVAEIARLASELLASVKAEATGDGESVTESNAEKASPTTPAAPEVPQVAEQAAPESKSDEPAPAGSASERLRTELELLELDSYTI
jgi:HK97 family phage prohead protease